MNASILKIRKKVSQKEITSPYLRLSQHLFKVLSIASQQAGWNHERYAQYRLFKLELENEALRIKNNNWEKLISHTINKYSDAKAFWRQIRRLKGTTKNNSTYIMRNYRRQRQRENF